MPRYYGYKYFKQPKDDKLTDGENINVKFSGSLRTYQKPVVNKCLKHLKDKGGGVLSVYCGYGKTTCLLYIVSKVKIKTLIVVHTEDLMEQWKDRIYEFLPGTKVGIIRQNKIEIDNKDVVIAMVQSLSLREYDPEIFKSFGMVVYDEIHLMATNVFSRSFPKVSCKYTFGLSATPYRADKCERIFESFIGPVIHYEKRPPNDGLVVKCVKYKINGFQPVLDKNGDPSYTNTTIKICMDEGRITEIVNQTILMVKEHRKVLILGEYIEHLRMIKTHLALHNYKDFTYGLYIGEMKKDERRESQGMDVILGTYKLASVGMDIPDLNTLILASPRKEIEQSVGRILRKSGKLKPIIIDFMDVFYFYFNQARIRQQFYKEYGYSLKFYNANNNDNGIEEDHYNYTKEEKPSGFVIRAE